jgi:hypothetical protein
MRDRTGTGRGTHPAVGPADSTPVLPPGPSADASTTAPDTGGGALPDAGAVIPDAAAGAKPTDAEAPRDEGTVGPADAAEAMEDHAPAVDDGGRTPRDASARADAAAAVGKATIDSRPWSLVFWRGRRLGETPVINVELPAGNQPLVLVDEAGRRYNRTIRILAGRSVRERFDLVEP